MNAQLDVVARSLPLNVPFTISRGTQRQAEVVHLRLALEGHVGWGEASPSPAVVPGTSTEVGAALAALDAAALDPEDIPGTMDALAGVPAAARAAVDLALHDLQGHRTDTPVHELLGLPEGEQPCAATITVADPDEAAKQAVTWTTRFFSVLKIKIDDAARGLAVVEAVRRVAPKATLLVDANEALDVQAAIDLAGPLADLGVALLEQPLDRHDRRGLARLAVESHLPIVLDESITSPADVEAHAELDGNLGFNIKVQKVGGLTAAVACFEAAKAQGRPAMVGCNIETGLGIAAGAALTGRVAHADLDGNLFLAGDPFPYPRHHPGTVCTLEGPGLGVHPDPRFAPAPGPAT